MSRPQPTPLNTVHTYHDPHKRNGGTAGHGSERHMRALYADDRRRNGVAWLRKGQRVASVRLDEVRITNVKTGERRTIESPSSKGRGYRTEEGWTWRETMRQMVTGRRAKTTTKPNYHA